MSVLALPSLQAMVWRGDRHVDGERDEFYVEQEDLRADDEHEDEGVRSIFATGWFRAVLVLTILTVVVMVALPYLLDWFEPGPSSVKVPPPAKQGNRSVAAPASPPPLRVAQPRPAPAPSLPAATLKPASAKPITPAAPVLPSYAPASEQLSEPVGMVKAAEPAPARTLELPKTASTRPRGEPSEASRSHWVQLGLFKDLSNAERLAKTLRGQGFSVHLTSVTRGPSDAAASETYHLVRVGAFSDEARALAVRDDLKSRGYVGFLTEGAAK
jgi:cell division septation protein DedD